MNRKNIIIFRDKILPLSETFIFNQAKNLSEFTPHFMGYKKVPNGINTSDFNTIINNENAPERNTLSEVFLKIIQFNPKFFVQGKKINPSLIHAHFGIDGVLALPLARQLKVPLVVTFHGYDITVKDEYLARQSFNVRNYVRKKHKLIKKGDLFIAVSNFIKNKMIEKGFPEHKIITHYIGVDLTRLVVNPEVQRKPAILFVGRLVKNKGCHILLDAMEYVFANCPECELWIVGDGPEKNTLEKKARKFGSKVKFMGSLSYDEVIRTMNMATILSVPSIEVESGASEGFGMVFAEANAMGLPVASFKTGGIPEAVLDGETGFLVEPGDTKALAHSIVELMNNKDLWRRMSDSGMNRVRRDLDIVKQTKKLEDIYFNLVTCEQR